MEEEEDLSGRRIGDFHLRERIGQGGFGAVYSCHQPLLGREAVIKVLHRRLRERDIIVRRFFREAQLASRLDHPYAAHVYAFGAEADDRLLWIAMERVHGVTLAAWLNTHGPMPLAMFVSFFKHIAGVIQTAHERGIVHRDLKPANIMLIERAGELLPKLLDFGVAKMFDGIARTESAPDEDSDQEPTLPRDASRRHPVGAARPSDVSTVTGTTSQPGGEVRLTNRDSAVGSPPYMSPEQWGNADTVGPASDLYALAVVAFEALTGRRPFQAATMADYAELHCTGKVPPIGSRFPPALDRWFQRALAKHPEDRWATALEMANELCSASGLGSVRAGLPKIDDPVRDAWLDRAPQPLAESVAALVAASQAHQARDAAQELVRTLLRYLLALALATWRGDDQGDPALLELVRSLRKRELTADERLQLLRLLVRTRGDHPVPELVDLVTPGPDGADALEPILEFYWITDHSGSEDSVRQRLRRLLPGLTQLLHRSSFLLDYVLVVPHNGAAERWTGQRQEHRGIVAGLSGELLEGHPMVLDRKGRICADLWPLAQAAAPSDGVAPELFILDGRSRHGAQLIAAPRGIVRDDSTTWDWITNRLIAEVEAKARMRDQIQTAARQWEDQARSDGLLWRGDALEGFERWTRHTAAAPLGDLEAAFIAASRRAARRARWLRRLLVTGGTMAALVALQYRAAMHARIADDQAALSQQQARMAQEQVTQAEVEAGRQALLHDEFDEAQLHLAEAYQRGDHSPSVAFMFARALQPLRAEQARFASTSGRMWSAAFSPDGRQIVTTDDVSAQVWDARTNRLLFRLPHGTTVYHAVYSADGRRLVTGAADGVVRIWDPATGALSRELRCKRKDGKAPRFTVVALAQNGRVAAIDLDGVVADVWDADSGALLAELDNDPAEYARLAFSADGRWLVTTGGNDARIFETHTWTRALTIAGPHIRSVSFDPTGSRLATGTADGDAAIWAIPNGERLRHLREIGEPVDRVAFSPDGALLVTATRDGTEQIWSAQSGALQSQNNFLRGKIESIEFDLSSRLVVAAGTNGTVVVADASLGMPVSLLNGPRGRVRVAHFDPTSRRVVGASWDGTARVWDATSPYRRWASRPIAEDCGAASGPEPDGRFVASTCKDQGTRIWDTAHNQLLAELPSTTPVGGGFASAFPAVSAAGDRAAIARGDTVGIYELPGGRLLRTIVHTAPVNAVAFAATGHDVVSTSIDGAMLITHDGMPPMALPAFPGGVDVVAFLPDGRVVAAGARRHLRVYDPDRRDVLADLVMPGRAGSLRSSPDSLRAIAVSLYTSNPATPPVLWDLERYRVVGKLEGHIGRVFSARFVAEGEILTAGGDGTVQRWDAATGQRRQIYRGGLLAMNLAMLKKTRRAPEVGDIFVMQPPDGQFLFGRVIDTNADPLGVGGAVLIYIYRIRAAAKTPVPELLRGQLLVPPVMTNKQPWTKGYFEHVENRPLSAMDRLPQHCFKDTRGWYFDQVGKRLAGPAEPVGQWGLHSYRTIDDEISKALGIPLSPDE